MYNNRRRLSYKLNNNAVENNCKKCDVSNGYYAKNDNTLSTNDENSCDCGYDKKESVFPENPVLGQSYVPIQKMDKTFIPCVGLKMGTIFPELVSPYRPCQSLEEIAFIKSMNTVKEGCNKC